MLLLLLFLPVLSPPGLHFACARWRRNGDDNMYAVRDSGRYSLLHLRFFHSVTAIVFRDGAAQINFDELMTDVDASRTERTR